MARTSITKSKRVALSLFFPVLVAVVFLARTDSAQTGPVWPMGGDLGGSLPNPKVLQAQSGAVTFTAAGDVESSSSFRNYVMGLSFSAGAYGPGFWLGTAAASPSLSNYFLLTDNVGNSYLGAPGSSGAGQIYFAQNGSSAEIFTSQGTASTAFFGNGAGGFDLYVGGLDPPTAMHLAAYQTDTFHFGFQVVPTSSPIYNLLTTSANIVYDAPPADLPTNPMTITGQSAYTAAATHLTGGSVTIAPGSGATTNGTPGNVAVALPAPTGTGTHASFSVSDNSSQVFRAGVDPSGQDALWLGTATSASGAAMIGDGVTFTYLNNPTAVGFVINDSTFAEYCSATNAYFGNVTATSAYEYLDFSTSAKLHFGVAATSSAAVQYDAKTADSPTEALTIQGQSADPGAATNLAGGALILQPGTGATTNGTPGNLLVSLPAPTGTGTHAAFVIDDGGSQVFRAGVDPSGQDALWLGTATTAGGAAMIGDGVTFTYLNNPTAVGLVLSDATFMQMNTAAGTQLFVTSGAADFGGGSKVLGLGAVGTFPTAEASTTGDSVLVSNPSGLYYVGSYAGGQLDGIELAPTVTGTHNSQAGGYFVQKAFSRSTTATAVTAITVSLSTAEQCAWVYMDATYHGSSTGATAGGFLSWVLACNHSGTVSLSSLGNIATPNLGSATGALGVTTSGTNLLIQVNSGATATYDWTVIASYPVN